MFTPIQEILDELCASCIVVLVDDENRGSEPRRAAKLDNDQTPRRLARRPWASLIKRV